MPFALPLAERIAVLLDRTEDPGGPEAVEPARSSVQAAVTEALGRGETHYTDRPGLPGLRRKIAAGLGRRFGLDAEAAGDVIVTCGVTEARFVAVQEMLRVGGTIAAPAAKQRIFGAALLRRATLGEELSEATDLLYVQSSMRENEMLRLLPGVGERTVVLFEVDEPESGFHPAQVEGFAGRTVTIGDMGEASWRIGYLHTPRAMGAGMRDFEQALTICSTNLSQWACLAEEVEL